MIESTLFSKTFSFTKLHICHINSVCLIGNSTVFSGALHFYQTTTNWEGVQKGAESTYGPSEASVSMEEILGEGSAVKTNDWINDIITRKSGRTGTTPSVKCIPAKSLIRRGHEIREQYACLLQRVRSAEMLFESSVAMLDRCRAYVHKKSRLDSV